MLASKANETLTPDPHGAFPAAVEPLAAGLRAGLPTSLVLAVTACSQDYETAASRRAAEAPGR